MDGPDDSRSSDFDWRNFEQFFNGKSQSPFPARPDLSWIENYVQDALQKAFHNPDRYVAAQSQVNADQFETHNSIIVKLHIPKKSDVQNMKVLVGVRQIRLEGFGGNPEPQWIKLNTPVIPSTSKAVYKDGVMQLQMKKRAFDDDDFFEPTIRLID